MKIKTTLFIYKWLPIVFHCHCKEERSFIIHNRKFPICARCTGELIGIILAFIAYFLFNMPSIPICIIMMIPLIADGFIQQLTTYESTNIKRFITGFLFGIALYVLFIRSCIFCIQTGDTCAALLFDR